MSDIFEDPWIKPKNTDKLIRIGVGGFFSLLAITIIVLLITVGCYYP